MNPGGSPAPRIRRFTPADLPGLYALLSDVEVMRWLEPPFTREKAARFLQSAGLSEPPLIYAAEDAEGRFIGYVIYHAYDADSMEIGWVLTRGVWGKGYAQRLTAALIRQAHSAGKAAVIECLPEQRISRHIAEKFGFIRAGQRDACDVYRLEPRK